MLNPKMTERAAEFWTDRQHQQFNDAADAAADRFEDAMNRAEAFVTFNEVLKRLRSLSSKKKAELMTLFAEDSAHFRWSIDNVFRDAFADQCKRRARRDLAQQVHVRLGDEI